MPVHSVIPCHDDRGVAHAIDIAAFDIVLNVYVVAPFFVHQSERIVARRYWLGHRRQFFDVDDDLLGQILGFRTVCTEACRDTLAGEPNLVGGKRMVMGGDCYNYAMLASGHLDIDMRDPGRDHHNEDNQRERMLMAPERQEAITAAATNTLDAHLDLEAELMKACGEHPDYAEGVAQLDIRPNTAVVVATRGHREDDRALEAAVRSPAGYVGLVGSRRKSILIYEELLQHGIPLERLKAVHAPVGLDIGAKTPEEIALSIVAEIVAFREGRSGKPMTMEARYLQTIATKLGVPA